MMPVLILNKKELKNRRISICGYLQRMSQMMQCMSDSKGQGLIDQLNQDIIYYSVSTSSGMLGSPIICYEGQSPFIIGLHCGYSTQKRLNFGIIFTKSNIQQINHFAFNILGHVIAFQYKKYLFQSKIEKIPEDNEKEPELSQYTKDSFKDRSERSVLENKIIQIEEYNFVESIVAYSFKNKTSLLIQTQLHSPNSIEFEFHSKDNDHINKNKIQRSYSYLLEKLEQKDVSLACKYYYQMFHQQISIQQRKQHCQLKDKFISIKDTNKKALMFLVLEQILKQKGLNLYFCRKSTKKSQLSMRVLTCASQFFIHKDVKMITIEESGQ